MGSSRLSKLERLGLLLDGKLRKYKREALSPFPLRRCPPAINLNNLPCHIAACGILKMLKKPPHQIDLHVIPISDIPQRCPNVYGCMTHQWKR
ncbi:hypothetical protein [Scytonema sp. PCC 10023]|uniref:hypothetical protein n=1 Tax=Scytonema sp. PCC 10023 TaxID=1680591 RepID=UPI0039C72A1C